MRIDSHEIDTQARKIIPLAFPREWEFREKTGRDYGIDMEIELFQNKTETGNTLLLQIKGTEKNIIVNNKIVQFDMPISTLLYAEIFITPILLTYCSINSSDLTIYYLWLQDYIKTVLNIEKPNWKKNKATVRVNIPASNAMPGNEKHLFYISHFPKRLYGACDIARILSSIKYILDGEPPESDYMKAATMLEQILSIKGYFNSVWERGEMYKNEYLKPAILAGKLLSQSKLPSDSELAKLPLLAGSKRSIPDFLSKKEYLKFQLRSQLKHGLDCIELLFEETNYHYKNLLWNEYSDHDF